MKWEIELTPSINFSVHTGSDQWLHCPYYYGRSL